MREKLYHFQGNSHKAFSRFLSKNFMGQERVGWYIQSAKRKKKTCQPKILYPEKLSLINEGGIRPFPDIQGSSSLFALQEMLKGVLEAEIKGH